MDAPNPLPTMGRVVWVTFDVQQIVGGEKQIVTRPADVTAVHEGGKLNVVAKLDGPNDTPAEFHRYGSPPCTKWLGNVPHDPTGAKVPSWRWPPRA